ncbi:MAG: hypothetical protein K9H58_08130 [Bacteroidales bacterium]|nr:hypothetical protein [Bacteroidales bacterium]
MKTFFLTILTILIGAGFLMAQSIERNVIASSGDYFEGANISLSWTLGEIATETYTVADNILTQGFQQPGISLRIYVDVMAFLEGAFDVSEMNANLNSEGLLPLSQPFNSAPWNYAGTESVLAIPNNEIVDWLLVELRDAASATTADPSTTIAKQAAFIRSDGAVVGLDGSSNLEFSNSISDQLFVVLWHRNHLGLMSAFALTEAGGVYDYNFTTAMGMAHMNGQKSLNGSVYGMYAGDGDGNGSINTNDKLLWESDAGEIGYRATDYDMNGQITNQDKNDKWQSNNGTISTIPE